MLSHFPQTLEVLIKISPHFRKLNNKILRKTLASRVNVEQAAGIAGVDLAMMLYELNKSINCEINPKTLKVEESQVMTKDEKPEILKKINPEKFLRLDVRPIIDSGKDPFLEIMNAVKNLKDDEVLHLVNSFEPIPLYSVMQNKGFSHWTEKDGGVFNVYFFKREELKNIPTEEMPSESTVAKDYEKVIELDVRKLAPPEPMMKILEKISEVNEKTIMVVHHHREPVMLYPKLDERGYSAISNKIDENYFKVIITKKTKELI